MPHIFSYYASNVNAVKCAIRGICHGSEHSRSQSITGGVMKLRKLAKDPSSNQGACPAVYVAEDDPAVMVVQGKFLDAAYDRRARRRARRRDGRAHPRRDDRARCREVPRRAAPAVLMAQRVIRDLDDPAFGRLFTDVRASWFRLETLQRYDVDVRARRLRRVSARRADRHHARTVAGDDPRARRRRTRARARARDRGAPQRLHPLRAARHTRRTSTPARTCA